VEGLATGMAVSGCSDSVRCKKEVAESSIEKTANLNLPDDSENCSNNLSNASRSMVKLEQRHEENDANEVTAVATIIPVAANEPTKGDDDDDDDALHLDEY
jgi:hypothetical protein